MALADDYQRFKPLLFSIAYRMIGSVSDAEDIVQEAFLRYHRASSGDPEIESPKAYLVAVTTRASIDYLRSARVRRESYVGAWLPEPLMTGGEGDPQNHAETADSLSMAFLVLLESLSPEERASFLLHDVFGYSYEEIAEVVDKSEANCRQLASRARRRVAERKPRFEASRRQRDELADEFFRAVEEGSMDGLVAMLAEDVVVHGDSGGIPPSWPRPIVGRHNVSRLIAGLSGQLRAVGVVIRRTEVNGQPGALFLDPEGHLINVWLLDIFGGAVQTIRSVINPAKLRHLAPLADVPALREKLRSTE